MGEKGVRGIGERRIQERGRQRRGLACLRWFWGGETLWGGGDYRRRVLVKGGEGEWVSREGEGGR